MDHMAEWEDMGQSEDPGQWRGQAITLSPKTVFCPHGYGLCHIDMVRGLLVAHSAEASEAWDPPDFCAQFTADFRDLREIGCRLWPVCWLYMLAPPSLSSATVLSVTSPIPPQPPCLDGSDFFLIFNYCCWASFIMCETTSDQVELFEVINFDQI